MYILVNLYSHFDSESFSHGVEFITTALDMELDIKVILSQDALLALSKIDCKDNAKKLLQLKLYESPCFYLSDKNIDDFDDIYNFIKKINKIEYKEIILKAHEVLTF